ncbi:MAG: FMN-binding negative transcriptional regulator [Chthoniobacterales bacterium]
MYVPPFNRVAERSQIVDFIAKHGFATVISKDEAGLTASHLPVLWDEDGTEWGTLRSHMARANSQWHHFISGEEVLCIFHGPHAYISPSCYVMQHTVPTWNYAAAHVYGVPKVTDESALRQVVYDTTDKYESGMPQPWKIPLTEQEIAPMLKAIVGFSIEITRVEAKFKLGQNRSVEDQEKMLCGLKHSGDPGSVELAKFIHAQKNL